MRMNYLEYLFMTFDAGREPYLKSIVKELHRVSSLETGKIILEIGCGNGIGSRMIDEIFQPRELVATEYDPRLVEVARLKNQGSKIRVEPGDATNLKFSDNKFDAVVGLSVIHHIPNWRRCVEELRRVIKPGGYLIIKELSIETFETPIGRIAKRLVEHPYGSMLSREKFIKHTAKTGFDISYLHLSTRFFWMKDFLLVARKK